MLANRGSTVRRCVSSKRLVFALILTDTGIDNWHCGLRALGRFVVRCFGHGGSPIVKCLKVRY